jgi:DNA invertase Pin-like site-specific DNA recombinase
MKAIAYIRWSSDEQTDGNSLERQTKFTATYAERNNLTIVETLIDDGHSAFSGAHIAKGKFGVFLKRAREGKYRGFALIVENPDRLTRQGYRKLIHLLEDLLSYGIETHITQKNWIFRTEEDLDRVDVGVMAVVHGVKDKEHSSNLSEKVGNAWSDKKHKSEPGICITQKLPGWLGGKLGEPITVDKYKAKVVRRIFEMTAKGQGTRLITRRFNEQEVPTFGGGKRKSEKWVQSYVRKILGNRAVLGEYQPYKGKGRNRIKDGDVRLDFFPAVITPELWERAQAATASRRTTTDNGTTTGKYPGRTGKLYNLFAGLVHDATLGLPMHWRDKGKRDKPRLVTNSKEINGTTPNTLPYAPFEKTFLYWLDQLDWTEIIDIADSSDIKQIEEEVSTFDLQIARAETERQKLVDIILTLSTPAAALNERLLNLEARVASDRTAKESAEKRLADAKSKHRDLLDESILYENLSKTKDLETRSRLRQEIRRKVSRIDVHFDKVAKSFGNADALAKIHFVNGAERWLAFHFALPLPPVQVYITE